MTDTPHPTTLPPATKPMPKDPKIPLDKNEPDLGPDGPKVTLS